MNDSQKNPGRGSGRRQLVLLVALFAAPLLIAYALYYGGWRSLPAPTHGDFLDPARPVGDAALRALDGAAASFDQLRGKWNLIYFGKAACLKPCRDNLYNLKQVVASLDKNAARVNRVFIVTDGGKPPADVLGDYRGTLVFTAAREALLRLADDFTLPAGSPLASLDRIYLVDPLGNLVLSYPAGADPAGLRKDLARLLRASRIG